MLELFQNIKKKSKETFKLRTSKKEKTLREKRTSNWNNIKTYNQNKAQELSIDFLLKEVIQTFNDILRTNIYENCLDNNQIQEHLNQKKELRKALRNCPYGDRLSKVFVIDYIKDILIKKYKLNNENINTVISFYDTQKLSSQDKFDIMLYFLEKDHGNNALNYLITEYKLDKPKITEDNIQYYEISDMDIINVYDEISVYSLNFNDKLNIISQRIYQLYKGNGVIDQIRDMKIDGVSAGVSGIAEGYEFDDLEALKELPTSYESIWLFFKGKSIYLSFLSFTSYKELIRVCKNIYKYNSPGQLSEATGYIVNEMKDGSRVSVARPPFAESWVLFIRKFDSVLQDNIYNLVTDSNNYIPIGIMKLLIKGCQVIGVTGEQGSGKTTLLMALISFINPTYNLRIQELSFELNLRKIYPRRNIVTFRETNTISGQDGLNFQKKTDGTVNILGEVATAPVANWLVQMALVASRFTIFTHHAKTTENLVVSLRNALLLEGGFNNEIVATEQVVDAIRFDIHMKKQLDGHRYIERITEIVPSKKNTYAERNNMTKTMFETRDIVIYKKGRYYMKDMISQETFNEICSNLMDVEEKEFINNLKEWRECSNVKLFEKNQF